MSNIKIKEYETLIRVIHNLTDLKSKSFLITGATGLIGSYLIEFLLYLNNEYGYDNHITALSRSKTKITNIFNNKDICVVEQNLNKPIVLNRKFDYIIHLASNSHPLAFSTDPVGTMKTNLIGTINLLETIKESTTKFLYASTGEVYGNNIDKPFIESDFGVVDTKIARSCYPESKRAAETICVSYAKQYGIDINVARFCYVYGSTITEENSRADAQFLRNALNGEDIVLKSAGKQKRTYCYVADAVSGLLTILISGSSGEFYNVSNPNSIISVRQYAQLLANISGVKLKFEIPDDIERQGYSKQANSILDSSKLMNLGWRPVYNIEKGIENTYKIKKELLCLKN